MELKLFHMGEVSQMTDEQVKMVDEFIGSLLYGIIATNNPESGARLSALNNLSGQSLKKALHFGTDSTSQKVRNIQVDPRCEVMYTDAAGSQIMINGKAEILTDVEIKRVLWQPWMDEFSPEGAIGNGICIIRLIPESVRVMFI